MLAEVKTVCSSLDATIPIDLVHTKYNILIDEECI